MSIEKACCKTPKYFVNISKYHILYYITGKGDTPYWINASATYGDVMWPIWAPPSAAVAAEDGSLYSV